MIGAIIGDIAGSVYEHHSVKSTELSLFGAECRFTDDTVLTVATADALLSGEPYDRAYRRWGRRYPRAGYGRAFRGWLRQDDAGPYQSWGNGSAMRVSPVGFARDSVEDVLAKAARSAAVTHDHAEGIKGAQAAALAVYLARIGRSKPEIRAELTDQFGYDISRSLADIRPTYGFDVSCQRSVPEALIAFLDTPDLDGAIRAAISLGGDADTQAAIAGSIAAAYDGQVAPALEDEALRRLPEEMRDILQAFHDRYPLGGPRQTSSA